MNETKLINGWTIMNDDSMRYGRPLNDHGSFQFVEIISIPNGTYQVVSSSIDLDDMTHSEIEQALLSCGYAKDDIAHIENLFPEQTSMYVAEAVWQNVMWNSEFVVNNKTFNTLRDTKDYLQAYIKGKEA